MQTPAATPLSPRELYEQAQVVYVDLGILSQALDHEYHTDNDQHTTVQWCARFDRMARVAARANVRAIRRYSAYIAYLTQGAV